MVGEPIRRRVFEPSSEHRKTAPCALAARHGLNAKTVCKWRRRTTAADAPTGPKTPKSTVLTTAVRAEDSASLDALGYLKDAIPNLGRGTQHRYLQGHNI
jgi:hypothetical protein